jgi:hypothetical protein
MIAKLLISSASALDFCCNTHTNMCSQNVVNFTQTTFFGDIRIIDAMKHIE